MNRYIRYMVAGDDISMWNLQKSESYGGGRDWGDY